VSNEARQIFGALLGPDGSVLQRTELYRTDSVAVDLLAGEANRSVPSTIRVADNLHALLFVCVGTLLLRRELDARWTVVAPQTIVYIGGRSDLVVNIARGNHRIHAVRWVRDSARALDSWIDEQVDMEPGRRGTRGSVRSKPMSSGCMQTVEHLGETCKNSAADALPSLFGTIHTSVGNVLVGESEVGLSPLPADLPHVIKTLTRKVREHPEIPWPLKDAADQVGYSPFHFSRVFKSLVGYGFHEYVDRCRTEHAVVLLSTTDDPVDIISSEAGFGTAQSLRESVKEHLGLLPSELRGAPDENAAS
jgi:AraC-like DNA-binding protein